MSSRSKGKRYELEIAHEIEDIFPDVHRNWQEQSAKGGVDLSNTKPFNIEVKGGKQANIAKTRKWLEQVKREGREENYDVVVARPLREEKFILMPFDDWKELVNILKKEGII